MPRSSTLFAAILGAGALLLSSAASNAALEGSKGEQDDGQKRVCKQEKRTGTRFAKTRCMTRAERDAIEEAAKRKAADMLNSPRINPGLGNGG